MVKLRGQNKRENKQQNNLGKEFGFVNDTETGSLVTDHLMNVDVLLMLTVLNLMSFLK